MSTDLAVVPDALTAPTRIVGIGASAGGLESLEQLFGELPSDTGMAFVVVQHLSPDFRSLMDELIARHSEMPVLLASDGVEVLANHVYLMPPGKEMIIRERKLRLTDKDPTHGLSLPIDQFFRSLAIDQGPQAVAIVLSGSGTDGSRGVVDVKRAGGMVLAESAGSARFDGMPLSAIQSGAVDHARVPRDLARILRGLPPLEATETPEELSDDPAMNAILRLLRDQFGIDFSLYKTTTVTRRIQRRLGLLFHKTVKAYAEQLEHDGEELNALYQDLLIGVTQFFRDPDAFALLDREVIPQLLDQVPAGEDLRVWVAGCATGEEAYSLAMMFHEHMTARERPVTLKILATDVHPLSLEIASSGLYGEDQLANVSQARLDRYFTRRAGGFQISQDLRQLIIFARHNVTKDAPFTKMHFISCRNMLIYFQTPAQRSVLSLFHFGLASQGVLFLGASESVGPLADEFVTLDEHWKIYRKRRDVHLLAQVRMPMARSGGVRRPPVAIELPRPPAADPVLLHTYDKLLDRYMPPSFLVDSELGLIDSFAGAEALLKVRRRRPSSHILELIDGELRTVIGGAIQRALKEHGPVTYTGVRVPDGADGERRCTLSAEAFHHPRTGTRHVLVSFDGLTEPAQARPTGGERAPIAAIDLDSMSRDRMGELETELAYTRETLQATIEELETSNEEMQATNEELVASNEELQSTNEELHSVNEELYTVNAEYQAKITELKELNTDMAHLLEGTDVGTVFLDHDLRIRRFTSRIASVFRFLPHDLGRQISDFSHNIERDTLIDDIERVHRDGVVIEDEVRDGAGTPYFLRILPYRVAPGREKELPRGAVAEALPIHGVVLTLTDISALDKARARLAQLSAIVESSDDAIIGKRLDGTITTWNRGAERLYGYTAEEATGRSAHMLMVRGAERELEAFLDRIRRGEKVEHVQSMRLRKGGDPIDVSVTMSPVYDRNGEVCGASAIARDVSPLLVAQRELQERQERIELLLSSTAEAIFGLDRDGRCTFVNPAFLRMLGVDSSERLIGEPIHPLIHAPHPDGDGHGEGECEIYRAIRDGVATHSDDDTLWRADGTSTAIEFWSTPIRRGDVVVGAVVTCLDVTERKHAEAELKTASRRREQFLAMLSHELRNPLAAVLNAIRVMRRGRFDAEAMAKGQQVVERQSHHMARLLDDLLDVSRITRGKFELRKADVDLRGPIEAAIESTGPRFAERKITLDVSLPARPFAVHGDPNRLQQIVVNVLSNAATYSGSGTRVELRLERDGDEAVIRVRDHGMGIEPEMIGHIFELFVQADQRLDRSMGGLGVGLSLARTIVELHGGTISAHSDGRDRGSEFVVRLPLLRRAIETDEAVAPQTSRCKIVLVEDLDDSREMLRLLLESNGHTVVDVDDGPKAVEAIDRERPDVALVDIGLPGMNGYEVAQEIRRRPHLADVVMVALTGYGAPGDVEAARAAGFDEHIIKPARLDKIEEILARTTRC